MTISGLQGGLVTAACAKPADESAGERPETGLRMGRIGRLFKRRTAE
jgi:hypothetical protein